MSIVANKINTHPYVTFDQTICGGKALIHGTRIPIWSIVKWYKSGLSTEEILREFPHVPPAKIYAAFSYYYENEDDIEHDITENEDEETWREFLKSTNK